jgi:hypothetical protein
MDLNYICVLFIGFIIGRYCISVLDNILEVFNYIIANIITRISIRTESKKLEFEKESENIQELSPVIGYEYPQVPEECEFEAEDKKIGFYK